MSDVYYLNNSGPKYTDKIALIEAARDRYKTTGKTSYYTMNQHESPHYFTAEELGDPTDGSPFAASPEATDPRPFKIGNVVTLRDIEAPKMLVSREIEDKFNGTEFEGTVAVLWFNGNQEERRAFKAQLLKHVD